MGPARMRESLTMTPGIREQPRPEADMGEPNLLRRTVSAAAKFRECLSLNFSELDRPQPDQR
jgi:hypothetical protein